MKKPNLFDEFTSGEGTPTDVALDTIPLDQPLGRKVPNVFPRLTNFPYKIAIIGEVPGKDEESVGEPFVGQSGKLLTGMLAKAGIVRDACFLGNVCQYQPFNNNITNFDWEGTEMQEGITQLLVDLQTFQPNIVFCLGGTSLHLLKVGNVAPPKRKTPKGLVYKFPHPIGKWRGSLFMSHLGYKTTSSFHPAACLRLYSWTAYLWFDIVRCLSEGTTPILSIPQRNLRVEYTFEELIAELTRVTNEVELVGTDLEGYWNDLKCCSVAPSWDYSFIVPFAKLDGSHFWTEEQEIEVWRAFIKLMTTFKVLKIWQNGLYDRFVLQYGFQITVRGNIEDIMLKWAEWLCELRKSLATSASILTMEPYWKGDRLHAEEAEESEETE